MDSLASLPWLTIVFFHYNELFTTFSTRILQNVTSLINCKCCSVLTVTVTLECVKA